MRSSISRLAAVVIIGVAGQAAQGALTFYSTSAAFNAASTGITTEGFDATTPPPGFFTGFAGDLDKTTSVPGLVNPGDIQDGLRVHDVGTMTLGVIDPGLFGSASKIVGSSDGGAIDDTLELQFYNNNVTAVGAQLFSLFAGLEADTINVSVFGASGLLGTVDIATPTGDFGFLGVTSTEAITRIHLSSQNGWYEAVDNVQYGSAVPLPPALWGGLVSAVGAWWIRRRRFTRA